MRRPDLLCCKPEWTAFQSVLHWDSAGKCIPVHKKIQRTVPENTGNTRDATPSRERGRGGEEGRGGEAVKFMGSQTIGSSSCCPGYPPPGSAFFP